VSDDPKPPSPPTTEETFAAARATIDRFRAQVDAQLAAGKRTSPLPYRQNGQEVFVVRLTRMSENSRIIRMQSNHGIIDRLIRDPSVVDSVAFEDGVGYAFVTLHNGTLVIQSGFSKAITAATAADFERDLRLLLALPATLEQRELN
jgi:hypothetical protein